MEALEAIKQNPKVLRHIPKKKITLEMCLIAVQNHGWMLRYVPEELKTPELCLAAVKETYFALQHVPETLKTAKICLAAVQNFGFALEHLPEVLKTPEICLAAINNHGSLRDVPEALKTPELCLAAIQGRAWEIVYLPEKLNTLEFWRAAIRENVWALQYVPDELKTSEIYRDAVQGHGGMLQYVPEALKTLELCRIAVVGNIWALKHVPEDFKANSGLQVLLDIDAEIPPMPCADAILLPYNGLTPNDSLRLELPENAGHIRVRPKSGGYRSYVRRGKTWHKEITDFSLLHDEYWMYNNSHCIVRFTAEFPAEIASGPSPFFSDQLAMAQLCATSERATQMLRDSPVLFWFLTPYLHQFPGLDARALQQIFSEKRHVLLSRYFPQIEPWVIRFIQRLPKPQNCNTARLLLMRMLANQHALRALRHCKNPTWELLALACKRQDVFSLRCGKWILSGISGPHGKAHALVELYEDTIQLGRELGIDNLAAMLKSCKSADKLLALHATWANCFNKQAPTLRVRQSGKQFPLLPFPGNDIILPITTSYELLMEGNTMHHCVGAYSDRIRSGKSYIYKVMAPQRATLELRLCDSEEWWSIEQLKCHCNRTPEDHTFQQIEEWLYKSSVSGRRIASMCVPSGQGRPIRYLSKDEMKKLYDSERDAYGELLTCDNVFSFTMQPFPISWLLPEKWEVASHLTWARAKKNTPPHFEAGDLAAVFMNRTPSGWVHAGITVPRTLLDLDDLENLRNFCVNYSDSGSERGSYLPPLPMNEQKIQKLLTKSRNTFKNSAHGYTSLDLDRTFAFYEPQCRSLWPRFPRMVRALVCDPTEQSEAYPQWSRVILFSDGNGLVLIIPEDRYGLMYNPQIRREFYKKFDKENQSAPAELEYDIFSE